MTLPVDPAHPETKPERPQAARSVFDDTVSAVALLCWTLLLACLWLAWKAWRM